MKKVSAKKKIIVAYIPVLHEGYLRFFEKHPDAETLFLIGPDFIRDHKQLTKDLRAIEPDVMKKVIDMLGIFSKTRVICPKDLEKQNFKKVVLIMPNEDVMREIRQKFASKIEVEFDSMFLRWDKHKSSEGQAVNADQTISKKNFDIEIMKDLKKEAEKSSDWWRRIGAAIIKNGKVMMKTYNHAVPNEQIHYVEGDPRADFSKGVNVELSTAFHCEAKLIAEAARKGISLEGTSLYVTTFPCPPCAKLVAYSGIKKLFYSDGYGVLDGERILKSQGVKIVFVKNGSK